MYTYFVIQHDSILNYALINHAAYDLQQLSYYS